MESYYTSSDNLESLYANLTISDRDSGLENQAIQTVQNALNKDTRDYVIEGFLKYIINNYKSRIYLVTSNMQIQSQSEDIFCVTLTNVYKNINKFRFNSSFSTWLYRININVINEVKRKAWYRRAVYGKKTDYFDEEDKLDILWFNPSDSIETKILIDNCIRKLAPGYKKVVILYYLEGYEVLEIADILNISKGAVQSQLSKARNKMRSIIDHK